MSYFGLFDHKVIGSEDTKSGKVRICWLGGKGKLRDGRRGVNERKGKHKRQ